MSAAGQETVLSGAHAKTILNREGCGAALILLLILNILFFPCIWGHKSLLDSAQLCPSVLPTGSWSGKRVLMGWAKTLDGAAAAWFFEPSIAVTGDEYLKDGTIPLWNPYQAYGAPFAANMQSQPFYPLTILLSLHLTPFTYSLFLLIRLYIAGVFAYFYLRLFVSFIAAMAGAIASMLGGYFILYMTMPHVSVDVLIPAALFACESLLRKRSYGSFLAFTAVLFLVIVGGMPESSLMLLVFVYIYIALRIVCDGELRSLWIPLATRIALASIAGLCLSSVLLLPFLEFMRHSYNTHDPKIIGGAIPGLYHFTPDSTIFTFLFPLIYGQWHGLANQFGVIAFFLTLIAVLTVFARSKDRSGRQLPFLTIFFFGYAAVLLLKHYGIQPINDLGKLPLLRYVDFYKYSESVLSICVASLCAIGLERLMAGAASKAIVGTALGAAFATVPLAYFICEKTMIELIKTNRSAIQFANLAFAVAVCSLFCLAICLIVFDQPRRVLGVAIAVILTFEFSANYLLPIYYIYNSLPGQAQNPYQGAPYLNFLKHQDSHFERIFGRDRVLYPDWASVFELQDIRDLDAMYYYKYLPFLRNFIVPGSPAKTQELWDRFTGDDGEYAFQTPLEKRLLQLSSVKFLLSKKPYSEVSFKPVYTNEAAIYRYDDVLPRAAIYYRAEIEPNEGEVLKKLADPNLDIFRTVVLDRTKVKPFQLTSIVEVNQGAARGVEAANITSYRPQAVEIHANLNQSGILVLNDSDYPGWTVDIDGSRGKWVTVNYLFRGVFLAPGKHVVRFVYRPRTFYLGVSVAGVALVLLSVPGLLSARRRLRPRQSPVAA
ncbi:MAG TPA: YfhO family protein [Bryobacteraceae bacterium]|nr:YfhO family protein [Bryobacteraceae bacterium]